MEKENKAGARSGKRRSIIFRSWMQGGKDLARPGFTALGFLIITAISVFLTEAVIMLFIAVMPGFSVYTVALLDALILAILIIPMLYIFLFRPMVRHITERVKAEKKLSEYRAHLEQLVKERTEKLMTSNEKLQREIVERERAEQSIKDAYAELTQIFDAAADGMRVIDKDFNMIRLNREFAKLSGINGAGQAIGKKCYEVFKGPLCHTTECPMFRILSGEERVECEVEKERIDGKRIPCIVGATPFRGGGGEMIGIVEIFRDITERKQLEEQLFQSQKMEAVGRLAGGVAHDFNNLLTAIQGYAQLSMTQIDEGSPTYRNLKEISRTSIRAASLTRQLLLFSRKQPTELVPVDINKTIGNLLKMLHYLITENIGIYTELAPDLWSARSDEGSLEQVIMNLTVNSKDAMPQGGNLIVKTENVTIDEEASKLVLEARPGKFVCLSFTDTGIGIGEDIIHRIFDPFFTTKEIGKGTGLGLSVVYGIVKQHEGWIDVCSESGKGSTFKVYLPAVFGRAREETKRIRPLDEVMGRGERILVVEDEAEVLEFVKTVLAENGYAIFEAARAKEAVDIFEEEEGNFDLVFADVVLPDENGLQLVDRLLSRKPGIKLLLTSGYTDDKVQWAIIRDRGIPFIPKPYSFPALLRAVRAAIDAAD